MCGIVYIKRKDGRPAYKSVLKRYRAQKNRGQQGYGYVAIKDNKVVSYKRSPTEHEIITLMQQEDAPEILFHHRMPTSTPNVEEAAHPLLIEHSSFKHQYFVVHNGVISNTTELKKKHNEKGIGYTTELITGLISVLTNKVYKEGSKWNDSECIAIETALVLEGTQKEINSEGSAAIVGLQTNGTEVVDRFFYRNTGNPLKFHEDNIMITITSEGAGEVVGFNKVQHLKSDGGFGDHPIDVETPPSWRYTGSSRGDDFYKDKHWDDSSRSWVKNSSSQLSLPASEKSKNKWGLNWADSKKEEVGFVLPGDRERAMSIDEIIKSLGGLPRKHLYVATMTKDVLWGEYDKALGIEEALKNRIENMEDSALNIDLDDSFVFDQMMALDTKLRSVQEWLEELSDEITARESLEVGV